MQQEGVVYQAASSKLKEAPRSQLWQQFTGDTVTFPWNSLLNNVPMFAWVLLQSLQCKTERVHTRQAAPLDVLPDAANG